MMGDLCTGGLALDTTSDISETLSTAKTAPGEKECRMLNAEIAVCPYGHDFDKSAKRTP